MVRILLSFVFCILISSPLMFKTNTVNAAPSVNELGGDLCPNANIAKGIITDICWSCLLPIRLSGIGGEKPAGAASDSAFCLCKDKDNIPQIGMPLGFFQPSRIVSFSPTPYCMPSFGTRLVNTDPGHLTGVAKTDEPVEVEQTSFFHYKYWTFPLMQMLQMFTNADCSYDTFPAWDLAYFSEADPLYTDDMLSFLLFPESILFANPVALAVCTAECAAIAAGQEVEETFFCAGCNGNLYPMTGTVQTNDNPVRVTSLLTTRLLGVLHRRGQAMLTMGDHMTSGSCEPNYAPMIPKTQYRVSMLYPVPEARGNVKPIVNSSNSSPEDAGVGGTSPPAGQGDAGNGQTSAARFPLNDKCCHRLGDSIFKWGLQRNIPTKEHFVYLIYRWNDCCLRQ